MAPPPVFLGPGRARARRLRRRPFRRGAALHWPRLFALALNLAAWAAIAAGLARCLGG